MPDASPSDDEYEISLRDQRYFGAGVKRKRIHFVPSISASERPASATPVKPAASVAQTYLSIVLKKETVESREVQDSPKDISSKAGFVEICAVCKQPLAGEGHERSLTHQICLSHSHPPSHIDRTRKGLAVLEAQGWDPDSRKGLGSVGSEGRLYPVRAKDNADRAGLGATLASVKKLGKSEKLDAGRARQQDADAKRKAGDLRNAFYRSEDVERYLGEDQTNHALDLEAFRHAKHRR